MVNILINAITCNVGGGVQVTLSCLDNWLELNDGKTNFLFLVNESIKKNISNKCIKKNQIIFFKNNNMIFYMDFL